MRGAGLQQKKRHGVSRPSSIAGSGTPRTDFYADTDTTTGDLPQVIAFDDDNGDHFGVYYDPADEEFFIKSEKNDTWATPDSLSLGADNVWYTVEIAKTAYSGFPFA